VRLLSQTRSAERPGTARYHGDLGGSLRGDARAEFVFAGYAYGAFHFGGSGVGLWNGQSHAGGPPSV